MPTPDWDAVVAAAGAGGTPNRRRRASLTALAVAGLVAVGGRDAVLGRGDRAWPRRILVVAERVSRESRIDYAAASVRARKRPLLAWLPERHPAPSARNGHIAKTGDTVDLLGFRSGSTLASGSSVGRIQKSAQSCAPLTALESSSAPVDVLLIDQAFGHGTEHAWYGLNRFTAPALRLTAGIAADGVRSITLNDLSGSRTVPVVANAFLYVAEAPAVNQLVQRSWPYCRQGRDCPVRSALFGFGGFGAGRAAAPAPGPTSIQHHVSGGTIAWLDRRMPVGEPLTVVPGGMRLLVLRHAVFGRVLAPDPSLLFRIAVTLNTSRHGHKATGVCTWLIGNGSGIGPGAGSGGGGCAVRATLFAKSPLTWGVGIAEGSQEFATVSGLASDDVARITAFLSGGQTQPVPLADNAYIAVIARSDFPVRLVAYNGAGQVIGFALPGLGGVTNQVAPAPGRAGCSTCHQPDRRLGSALHRPRNQRRYLRLHPPLREQERKRRRGDLRAQPTRRPGDRQTPRDRADQHDWEPRRDPRIQHEPQRRNHRYPLQGRRPRHHPSHRRKGPLRDTPRQPLRRILFYRRDGTEQHRHDPRQRGIPAATIPTLTLQSPRIPPRGRPTGYANICS